MSKYVILFTLFILFTGNLQASIVILNGLTQTYQTNKGRVYKGKIEIQNTGSLPKTVKLYLQDLSYKSDGTIYYSAPGTNERTNTDWIRLNSNLINLNAKEKTEVFYEITVPDGISKAGSYWSTVIVEPVENIVPDKSSVGVQITSVVRYAIQIITNYSIESLKPELLFREIEVDTIGQKRLLKIALANTGDIYCKPVTSIEIYDTATGTRIDHLYSQAMGLLPNTSKTFLINLEKTPPGKYKAILYATDSDQSTFALEVELEI